MRVLSILALILGSVFAVADQATDYKNRYGLNNPNDKLVDNKGNGAEELYGVRNFRVVLHGYVYRGGANNSYNKHHKRSNMNPLQESALENLCEEGFKNSVYLYNTNFDTAPKSVNCSSGSIAYHQHSPHYLSEAHKILKKVHDTVRKNNGPIYLHCWNGWHASGLISAYTLMQFCNYTPEQAVQYWDLNTDGRNTDPKYESIRRRIRDFKVLPQYTLPPSISAKICP